MTITIEDNKKVKGAPYAVIHGGLRFLARDYIETLGIVKMILEREAQNEK